MCGKQNKYTLPVHQQKIYSKKDSGKIFPHPRVVSFSQNAEAHRIYAGF
jgi:hypothetical protein